ncbi:hypothetical protein [Acidovorax sp. ACV01]|uniref:hypothetical protein n=1 Tax=Acidovorax sp. ACV01 TaxID=2769311 RepID=UPI00177EF8E5|nr:hypothetical protein [Acidovorax sp. ACV01]MBD9393254.1 hypothetical protein [Acidovorax sp. ACV01]
MAKPVVAVIHGTIIAGGQLSQATILAVNQAATKAWAQWRRFVAYAGWVEAVARWPGAPAIRATCATRRSRSTTSPNDLGEWEKAGVCRDKDVNPQIDVLVPVVAASEGVIAGIEVPRS